MFVSKKKKESKIQEKTNKKKSIEQSCRINEALLRDVLARALEDLLRAGLTSSTIKSVGRSTKIGHEVKKRTQEFRNRHWGWHRPFLVRLYFARLCQGRA